MGLREFRDYSSPVPLKLPSALCAADSPFGSSRLCQGQSVASVRVLQKYSAEQKITENYWHMKKWPRVAMGTVVVELVSEAS